MRGKKSSPEFVSKFISECIEDGITNSEDILQMAKDHIKLIDDKIKEVKELKLKRSNLLDVVQTFDKPVPKMDEDKVLPLFQLEYPRVCKNICNLVQNKNTVPIENINGDSDLRFCLKRLLEYKVLSRFENIIVRGERFDEYMKLVFHQE